MATTIDDARKAIEARVAAQWANDRIRWPNVHFKPPDTDSWLAVDILWGDGFLSTKNGRNTVAGILSLTVFVLVGRGDGALSGLADDARDVVNRLEVSGVRFNAPSGPRFLVDSTSKWRQAQVTCSFTVDEEV